MVWLWRTFAVVSLLFILDRIVSTVGPDAEPPFANTRGVDVGAFYTVATMLRQGQRHELGRVDAQLEVQAAIQEREQTGWRWFEPMPHPPVVALAALPLTERSLRTAYWEFTIAAFLAAAFAAWLLARTLCPAAVLTITVVLLGFRPLWVLLWWGEDDTFVLVPVAVGILLLLTNHRSETGRPWRRELLAGALLGAIALRPQFAIVPFLALLLGRRMAAVGMAIGGGLLAVVSVVLVGFHDALDYAELWRRYGSPTLWHPGVAPTYMFNVRGAIERWDPSWFSQTRWWVALGGSVGLGLVVVALAGWALARDRASELALSLIIVGMLVTAFHSHQQSMIFLSIPLAICIGRSLTLPFWPSGVLWALPAIAFLIGALAIENELARQRVLTEIGLLVLVGFGVALIATLLRSESGRPVRANRAGSALGRILSLRPQRP